MKKKFTMMLLAACSAAMFVFAGALVANTADEEVSIPSDIPGLKYGLLQLKEGVAVGRVVAINGQPVSQDRFLQPQGGIAGTGGPCDGLCGAGSPANCGEEGQPDCDCNCDQMCFGFEDCCEDVCEDCPALLGCSQELDFMYFTPATGIPHPDGFAVLAATAHGETILADDHLRWSGGDVLYMGFTVANFSGAGANTELHDVGLRLHFYNFDVDLVDGGIVGSIPSPDAVDTNDPNLYTTIDIVVEGIDLPAGFGTLAIVLLDAGELQIERNSWAGIQYIQEGTVFSAGGSLDNLGQFMRHPPTFGSSLDRVWIEDVGVTVFGGLAAGGFVPVGHPVSSMGGWRFFGTHDYMGACGIGEIPVPEPPCPGDINGDGSVNGFDLVDLISCWGPVQTGCEGADINGDGVVNGFDLVDLISAWGPCPTGSVAGGEFECRLLSESECAAEEDSTFTKGLVTCTWPGVFTDDAAGACCFANGGCLSPTGGFPQSQSECEERVLCCHGDPGDYTDCDPIGVVEDGEPIWMTAAECTQEGGNPYTGVFQGAYVLCGEAQCGCASADACATSVGGVGTCLCGFECFQDGSCCLDVCGNCADLSNPEWNVCSGCEGQCGSPLPTADECFCDAGCAGFGDCCADFCDHCFDTNPSFCPQEEEASCNGWCGFEADDATAWCDAFPNDVGCVPDHNHSCSCDENCIMNVDDLGEEDPSRLCCLDFCEWCGGVKFDPNSNCPDPSSCADNDACGTITPGGCWCDSTCCAFQDCCEDQWSACGFCPNNHFLCGDGVAEHGKTGYCGMTVPGNSPGNPSCACDEACCIFQDCCADKVSFCGGCDPENVDVECPTGPDVFQEPEACGPGANPHNNNCANATDIECGDTYCGTVWLHINEETGAISRDFDFYHLEVTQPLLVNFCMAAEFVKLARIIQFPGTQSNPVCGGSPTTIATIPTDFPGVESCVMLTLDPGDYHVWIHGVSTQQEPEIFCTGKNEYTLSLECFPANANCIGKCGTATGVDGMVCGCDDECHSRGDCCVNACEVCDEELDGNCQSCAFPAYSDCGTEISTSPDGSCRCDEGCCPGQTCCLDKFDVCAGCDPIDYLTCAVLDENGDPTGETLCGSYGPAGCFCDVFCTFFGDCCPDFEAVCELELDLDLEDD